MSFLTVVLVIVALVALLLGGIAVSGVVAARSARDRAHAALQELCAARGWSFVEGSGMKEMYRIEAERFVVRARRMSDAGPAREQGLNTGFIADAPVAGTLWARPRGNTGSIRALTGEDVELEAVTTGDVEFDDRFQVGIRGADPAILTAEVRREMLQLPSSREVQVVVHPPGVAVLLLGTVANAADVHGMIRIGEEFLQV